MVHRTKRAGRYLLILGLAALHCAQHIAIHMVQITQVLSEQSNLFLCFLSVGYAALHCLGCFHQIAIEAVHSLQVVVGILEFQFIDSIQAAQILGQYLYLCVELLGAVSMLP